MEPNLKEKGSRVGNASDPAANLWKQKEEVEGKQEKEQHSILLFLPVTSLTRVFFFLFLASLWG